MKNNFLTVVITVVITAVVTSFATKNFCGKPNVHTTKPVGKFIAATDSFSPGHQYPVANAIADIDSFQTACDTLLAHMPPGSVPKNMGNGIVAYMISAYDLIHSLGIVSENGGAVGAIHPFVRVYIGFNAQAGFKLFVVPVDTSAGVAACSECGKDLFFVPVPHSQISPIPITIDTSKPGEGTVVLDLISPCPSTCDVSSQLVQGIKQTVACTACDTSSRKPAHKQ